MASRLGMFLLFPAVLTAGVVGETTARGQAAPPARVDPYQGGAPPAFPNRRAAVATPLAASVGVGAIDPMLIDPVAMNYLYATGVPMTRGQVGLSAVSSLQQASGIGSGRLSGVRGGVVENETRRSATHTRNPNVPGGQASGFFNRFGPSVPTSVSGSASASGSGRFYGRQSHYFPRPGR